MGYCKTPKNKIRNGPLAIYIYIMDFWPFIFSHINLPCDFLGLLIASYLVYMFIFKFYLLPSFLKFSQIHCNWLPV